MEEMSEVKIEKKKTEDEVEEWVMKRGHRKEDRREGGNGREAG